MVIERFDTYIRALIHAPSRREVLSVLAGLGAGFGAARLPDVANAKKKKRKHKKPKPNAYGCLEVGDACKYADQCCSGICTGKKGKRTCKAHDAGNCAAGDLPQACGGINVVCTTSVGIPGTCATTTGNAGHCFANGNCYACQTDVDCQEAFEGAFGPRAACIRCANCVDTDSTACAVPDLPAET